MGADKDRESNRLWLLLLLGLVAVLVAGLYLYLRFERFGRTALPALDRQATTQSYSIQPVKPEQNDVVKKVVFENGVARYQLFGRLVPPIEIDGSGNFLTARFQLERDDSERSMVVRAGYMEGELDVGYFEGSFEGSSTWKTEPLDAAISLLGGREVMLRLDFPLDTARSDFDYFHSLETEFDALIHSQRVGEYSVNLPDISPYIIPAIGVVRQEGE